MNNLKEKIKTNFNKNKKFILAFLVIWIVVVSVACYAFKDTLGKESYGNSLYEYIAYFYNNEVSQEVETVDQSKTISLFLSIQEKNGSDIKVTVKGNDSGTLYGEEILKDKNILNDSYNAVVLDTPLDKSKDKTITISIISENETHNNLGIWCSGATPFGEDTLFINGEIGQGNMTVKFLNDNSELQAFNNIIIGVSSIGGALIVLYLLLVEPKKENLFALAVLLLGLIYIVIITPIAGPDEDYHYKQAIRLSNKIMFKENVSLIEDVYVDYEGFTTQINNGKAYKAIIDRANEPMADLADRPTVEIPPSAAYPYSLCYAPFALGITVARIFEMNFLNTYYLGRLFNLLFYVVCVYVSIKNTPVLKNMFGVVSLFPMFIQQSITYTQDAWICALSMVVFSFALKWKFSETRIEKKDYIFAAIAVLLLAPAKYIYSLFAASFFMISSEKAISKKTKNILIAILSIVIVIAIGSNVINRVLPILQSPTFINGNTGLPMTEEEMLEINPKYSIRYVLMHPEQTLHLVINTFKVRTKTLVCTSVGRALSGGALLIPLEIVYGFMILAIIAALQKEEKILSIGNKVFVVSICVVIAGLILASMLVGWTKYYDDIIQGLQGRYFSPMIVYLLAVLSNKKIQIPQNIDKYLVSIELILSFLTIVNVLSYTFVN